MLSRKSNYNNARLWIYIIIVMVTACAPDILDAPSSVMTSPTRPSLTVVTQAIPTQSLPTHTPASTQTPIEETIAPTKIPTPLFTDTPTNESAGIPIIEDDHLLFIENYEQSYSQFDYSLSIQFNFEQGQPYPLHALDYKVSQEPNDPEIGPASATLISFAHFADKVAYWINDDVRQLWLSDLDLENPQLIYTDKDEVYSNADYEGREFNLRWTDDDLHLIWYTNDDSPNLIYHLQTQTIEPWPWKCDRIALSPRTNRLATWCISEESETRFAVIEWGGDIWYSDVPSMFELVKQDRIALFSPPIWAWSSDGERLAYFDPSSRVGEFSIVNAQGIAELSIPEAAWWQTEAVAESRIFLPSTLIQWSQDNSRLIVFAHELTTHACPLYRNYVSESDSFHDIPCWQVLEIESKSILWTWSDFLDDLNTSDNDTWQVWDASISPHGKRLAFNVAVPTGIELAIIDLENNISEQWGAFGGSGIRWKSIP